MVGHALLVQAGALLVELGLSALRLGLALGDPGSLLGLAGVSFALFSFGSMLAGDAVTPALQLALALFDLRAATHPGQCERHYGDDEQGGDDNRDDRGRGHLGLPPFLGMGLMQGFPRCLIPNPGRPSTCSRIRRIQTARYPPQKW
ncbi:hypothetical protein OJ997_09675 [Solirubrobacter phytolaccae]|uniref:Uncharacterized protein n=1 Tax=Solirubrobacter phytolaccae TaxID=1404360 RepID=A0A9X3S8P6_9ACTN|nr:hypothetical protein [Solirubrobacter phytolaccae]MDA0180561.1 hypothetical protein [Solirubrobacter phytolaccae]